MSNIIKSLVLLLIILFNKLIFSASVVSMQTTNQSNLNTLSLRLSGNYTYKVFTLSNPNRLVIDLTNTTLNFNLNNQKIANNLFNQVRIGHPSYNDLRLVFDLKEPISFKNVKIPISSSISVVKLEMTASKKNPSPSTNITKNTNTYRNSSPINIPPQRMRDVVVVIDPGHGGHDPGAIGMHHSREKNVVLDISKKLKSLIDRQPGMRAVLTRQSDYYVGLRQRMEIARKYNGDIFIAIHADAFGNHNSHGASVFALSQIGATSEAARWLAEKENYSELGGVNLSHLDDKNGVIRTVLIDLSQTATISASLNMGKSIINNLDRITSLHSKKVEQARFMVLKSPDIPSVLIETGFISNPLEEKNLTSYAYQMRLSQAIFAGIKTYFWNYPPYGSKIEAMSTANRRVAKRSLPFLSLKG
jgi:N-acetylmuramoyl-L-alanine amidase